MRSFPYPIRHAYLKGSRRFRFGIVPFADFDSAAGVRRPFVERPDLPMPVHDSMTREIERGPSGSRIAAFFDLDRTIIAGFSAFAFLLGWIVEGRGTVDGLGRTLLATLRFELGRIGFSALVAESSAMLAGMREEEYAELGRRIFRGWIAGDVYPESRALVKAHQRMGHTVAVVSSATRYQIEPVAADLGIEHVLCTQLEVRDGRFTGEVVHPTCFREGKAIAARELAARTGIDLEQSYFYTDSADDLPLLDVVGHPRPVNPDRRLAAIAAKRGWWARSFSSRGTPSAADLLRTLLTIASLGPSFALGLPVAVLDRDWRRAVNLAQTTWGELGTAMAGINVRVVGEEHLWSDRPAVFIFNHQSAVDVLLLCKLLRRDFVGIGKEEIRSYPLLGTLFSWAGTVFVDRFDHAKAMSALEPAVKTLSEGVSIAIAPEGTRSPSPRLGRFKKGAFHLARQAGVPIVPIVFLNALDALPKRGVVVRPTTVEAVVHPPIPTASWTPMDVDARIAEVRRLYLDTLEGRAP